MAFKSIEDMELEKEFKNLKKLMKFLLTRRRNQLMTSFSKFHSQAIPIDLHGMISPML